MVEVKNNFKKFLLNCKKNPNDFIEISEFQKFFDEVAKYLLGNVAIVFGPEPDGTKYYLAEIEFYYKNEKAKEIVIKSSEDNKKKVESSFYSCTYERNREAGQLFWHYSGIDICFDSNKNNYGGILIRSLIKITKGGQRELIAGPLRCANELMNQSVLEGKNSIPHIIELKRYDDYTIMSTIRQGLETSDKYKELREKIKIDDCGYVISDDFPLFCYFVQRGTNNWRTINGAKYNANPEERKGIIRKVPRC